MMNDDLNAVVSSFRGLGKEEEQEVMRLAAVGLKPRDIAVSMEWPEVRREAFCVLAAMPGSDVALLLEAGRAIGLATPRTKLQQAAEVGNVDAIKALHKMQAANRYNELLNHMDEDEFTD